MELCPLVVLLIDWQREREREREWESGAYL
jgi:hypothetical protein